MSVSNSNGNGKGYVHVICGLHEQRFAVVGKTVSQVKKALREVFSIGYFALAYVNDVVVDLGHRLADGERLEFNVPGGVKGAGTDGTSYAEQFSGALVTFSPELQTIAKQIKSLRLSKEESIDQAVQRIAEFFL